jgi:hypothetical protein
MSFGTIVYYILWPAVAFAILTFWMFSLASAAMNIGVEYIREFHEEIKNF